MKSNLYKELHEQDAWDSYGPYAAAALTAIAIIGFAVCAHYQIPISDIYGY